MRLTTEAVARFVGGQIEVVNAGEGYIFRGEIASIVVEEGTLRVETAWMAKNESDSPILKRWVNDVTHSTYVASLVIYTTRDIGSGPEGGGRRLLLNSSIVGETVVLFPPDGSKLDPARVEGLVLADAVDAKGTQCRHCRQGEAAHFDVGEGPPTCGNFSPRK